MGKLHEIDKITISFVINQPFSLCDNFWLIFLAQRRFVGRFFSIILPQTPGRILNEASPLGRHLFFVYIATWFISRNSAAHRLAVVDRRRSRFPSSRDAPSSSRFNVGSSHAPSSRVQGWAYMEHITLPIGRNQVTRSHAKWQRLADVLLRLSLPCNTNVILVVSDDMVVIREVWPHGQECFYVQRRNDSSPRSTDASNEPFHYLYMFTWLSSMPPTRDAIVSSRTSSREYWRLILLCLGTRYF